MPKPHPDPMRYVATKEEHKEAYEAAPHCHSLVHRLTIRREVKALEALLEKK